MGRPQGSSFKSQTIFLVHKIFIRVIFKNAINIEFNILTIFMESRFISHLLPHNLIHVKEGPKRLDKLIVVNELEIYSLHPTVTTIGTNSYVFS